MPISWSVLLTPSSSRDVMALAKALAKVRHTPVQDQVMVSRSCWGILAEGLNESDARALEDGLRVEGVDSRAIDSSSMISVSEPQIMSSYDFSMIDQLHLISAAAVTVTSTSTKTTKEGPTAAQKILNAGIMLSTGLPIKVGGKDRVVTRTKHQSDLEFTLDLYSGERLKHWRVDIQHFNYSFLGARKRYDLLGNFKVWLGELVAAAPGAIINHGARVLLENRPMNTMDYRHLKDLDRESQWLLTWRTLNDENTRRNS